MPKSHETDSFDLQIYRLTFWTRHSKEPRLDIDSMHSDSLSVETNSNNDEIELEKLNVYKPKPELIEADKTKKYSGYDEVYKDNEKKSLATEENVLDEKSIPLVVIEDQSERIITSRFDLDLFIRQNMDCVGTMVLLLQCSPFITLCLGSIGMY